ncbi:hypothetical protein GIY23_09885 [Allosaccharopolyspora coralli]|uniref:DUF4878 domain-containing protein n=1 Tax=Allosaccharopolyspora coralli TaxID=2665642 RepID=A0A5Q3Q5A8_9PSEU|nr:hypothetical protein [Allosaccharopolyspora coralli]QGK69788.1 hypothetical protein GIY23_09885 [Allosaccharopolyspora coralli]
MTDPPSRPEREGGDRPVTGAPAKAPQQQPAWYGNQASGLDDNERSAPPESGPQFPVAPGWSGVTGRNGPDQAPEDYLREPPGPVRRTGRVLAVGVLLLVLGALGAGVWYALNRGPGDPQPVARTVAHHLNADETASVESLLCTAERPTLQGQLRELARGRFDLRVAGTEGDGRVATARVSGTFELDGTSYPVDQTIGFVAENGSWKLCRLLE